MNISSDKIKVFPFAKYRNTVDLGSRLFYENNISRIIYQLVDTDGYVISGAVNSIGELTETLKINIHGYYFEIASGQSLIPSDETDTGKIYAYIKVSKEITDSTGSVLPPQLIGQDDNTKGFTAFNLTFTEPTGSEDDIFSIPLLVKDSSGWKINDSVYTKFDTKSLNITKIDGKH